MSTDCLFSALSRYGGTQGAENYLTECFCYLLRYLLAQEQSTATDILNRLCGSADAFALEDAEQTSVVSQRSLATGRIPDMTIAAPGKRVHVEVKYDAFPDKEKLADYRRALEARSEAFRVLVLLTRSRSTVPAGPDGPHLCVRWFQVHSWIAAALDERRVASGVGMFLLTEFKRFLEEHRMALERVGWELAPGVVELSRFVTMLDLALEIAELSEKMGPPRGTQTYIGRMIDSPRYWCGISYERPLYLFFQMCDCPSEVKEHLQKAYPDEYDGGFRLYIEDESTCFFSLPKERQLETLARFIRECYDRVVAAREGAGGPPAAPPAAEPPTGGES